MFPESESLQYFATAVHGRVEPGEVEEPLLAFLLDPLSDGQPGVVRPRGGGVSSQGKVRPAGHHLLPHNQVVIW